MGHGDDAGWDLYAARPLTDGGLRVSKLSSVPQETRVRWLNSMDAVSHGAQDRWLLVERSHRIFTSEVQNLREEPSITGPRVARRVNDVVGATFDWLGSMRMYVDQLAHMIGNNNPELLGEFRRKCSEQYDSRFGYRFCWRLRNYAQHLSIPIHTVAYGSGGWSIFVSPQVLLERYDGWSTLRDEMAAMDGDIDVVQQVNEAMYGLTEIARWRTIEQAPSLRTALQDAEALRDHFRREYDMHFPVYARCDPPVVGSMMSLTPINLWEIDTVRERLADLDPM
ncbi:MAG: hypothetical protein GEU93_09855 [Propionibacteriales bacterium]|nr:hypothetical protein [Propionibacteriales bacterium]